MSDEANYCQKRYDTRSNYWNRTKRNSRTTCRSCSEQGQLHGTTGRPCIVVKHNSAESCTSSSLHFRREHIDKKFLTWNKHVSQPVRHSQSSSPMVQRQNDWCRRRLKTRNRDAVPRMSEGRRQWKQQSVPKGASHTTTRGARRQIHERCPTDPTVT